ncbi:hypothetical protein FLL45_21960 [Aliikangiella marina]|uniref:HlyD family efflux transporter periplasmic adaptor subunit n=1 Tax=Aliikangiella marina TaxID=1712262 RepID=A0A545T1E1_9GAMM|nr:hypothetical protein [Aliikangiella marina]TQV70995.1 hypothetical protein FLL45_21960 [Aliikangiella marina]
MLKRLKTRFALPAVAGIGLILLVLVVQLQPDLQHDIQARPSVPVNYITLERHSIRPEIIGFGTVKPDLALQAKAEVTGRVTFINPALKKGEIFAKDTLLLKIDDKDYQLALKQAEADVLANQANLEEMKLVIQNNEVELQLAQEKLKVRENEFARLSQLRKSGSVSQSQLDSERQNLLQQQQEVQQLKNKQTTLPSDLEVMKAQLAIAEAKLERSQRDLARTEVRLPFNGRISKVHVELDQYVATGAQLFDASGLDKVVINAQFTMEQFSLFARGFNQREINLDDLQNFSNMKTMLASLGLSAKVELANGKFASWPAKVERFSDDLDPQSRTLGVTVSIEDNYRNIEPGTKPPLLEGMYMKVSLMGAPRDFIALPRFAIRDNQVLTITPENKLKRVRLSEIQTQGNLALVNNLLMPGDRIITSDLFPAVPGMDLTPIVDQVSQKQMTQWISSSEQKGD